MKLIKIPSRRRQTGARFQLVLCLVLSFSNLLSAEEHVNEAVLLLQKERIGILENLVKVRRMKYEEGQSSFLPLVRAMDDLADARYEIAATRAERHAICSEVVANWETFLKITTRLYEAGRVSQSEVLEARASYLQAKIRAAKVAPPKD